MMRWLAISTTWLVGVSGCTGVVGDCTAGQCQSSPGQQPAGFGDPNDFPDAGDPNSPASDTDTGDNLPPAGLWEPTTQQFLSQLRLVSEGSGGGNPPSDMFLAPGGIICVVAGGAIDHCTPFGYASTNNIDHVRDQPALQADSNLGTLVTEDSLFRLGSTGKMVVGLATAMCKHRGVISSYDDKLETYISELSGTDAGGSSLKQLFTHTSGLPLLHQVGLQESDQVVIRATMSDIIAGVRNLSINPGSVGRYSYSDVGVVLMSEVVSRVQVLSYEQFVKEEILVPLGMNHTYFHTSEIDQSLKTTGYEQTGPSSSSYGPVVDPDLQGYAPVGGMYATGPDMARLMGLFQKGLDPQGPRPLPIDADVVIDLTTVYLQDAGYTMGVSIDISYENGNTVMGHNGRIDGYASYFNFAEEAEIGLVFFANGGFPLGRTAAPSLLDILLH